jgi:ParB/RepB/Spo0J family partition protein
MFLSLSSIWIDRAARQRQELPLDDLLESIPLRGVIVPIIVTEEPGPEGQPYKLLAGERRLTASQKLGLPEIPVRLLKDLPLVEQQVIELEENVRRRDLTWQERVKAYKAIHQTLKSSRPEWTQEKTASHIGMAPWRFSRFMRVAKDIDRPEILKAESFERAFNYLSREDDRLAEDAVSTILTAFHESEPDLPFEDPVPVPQGEISPIPIPAPPPKPLVTPSETSILQESFLTFAPNYSGQPFNFIHCDFPYGTNVFGGKWSGRQSWSAYEDTPDIYFELIRALCSNLDRLMAHSGHLMFWLSADITIQARTIELFGQLAPSLAFSTFPLTWVKSDNVGIVPDPKREPRRITETALVASRDDRLIIRPVANAISAPTSKEHHPHTKPEPVLKHFFQMFVDPHTRMLDPTSGGGSSLRAAEALGASHVLGLEIDQTYVENSRKALHSFRVLRKMSEMQKEQN